MSRCLDCTECRTCPGIMPDKVKDYVWCRQRIFDPMPPNHAFLKVHRKCFYFEEEGVDDNITGNQGSNR